MWNVCRQWSRQISLHENFICVTNTSVWIYIYIYIVFAWSVLSICVKNYIFAEGQNILISNYDGVITPYSVEWINIVRRFTHIDLINAPSYVMSVLIGWYNLECQPDISYISVYWIVYIYIYILLITFVGANISSLLEALLNPGLCIR